VSGVLVRSSGVEEVETELLIRLVGFLYLLIRVKSLLEIG
jgi:hypothetical protein